MTPFPRRMWGAGRVEWDRDLRVGTIAERISAVRSARTTTGASGTLLLIVVDHEYHQDGVPVASASGRRSSIATRPPIRCRCRSTSPRPRRRDGAWSTRSQPAPTVLFRFSAITFNTHRIHYDLPYARDVEGYPGLVVQGPLTAMMVAGFVERSSGRRLASYEFKATAPMFAGLSATIDVLPPGDDGTGTAQVLRNDGAVAMRVDYALRRPLMARCFLYVPGHRPDRFAKALASGSDAVILDLEDAVPVGAKDIARHDVRAFLDGLTPGPVETWVRINDGERGQDDLQALAGLAALAGVVVPKATPDVLAVRHNDAPDVALIPLVESATAITQVVAIAASAAVRTLAIGEVDLAADLGLGDDVPAAALWALRMQVVVACAATGRAAPLGPVIRDLDDLAGFAATVHELRHAGFGAQQAIHPKQVAIVNDELTPSGGRRRRCPAAPRGRRTSRRRRLRRPHRSHDRRGRPALRPAHARLGRAAGAVMPSRPVAPGQPARRPHVPGPRRRAGADAGLGDAVHVPTSGRSPR